MTTRETDSLPLWHGRTVEHEAGHRDAVTRGVMGDPVQDLPVGTRVRVPKGQSVPDGGEWGDDAR